MNANLYCNLGFIEQGKMTTQYAPDEIEGILTLVESQRYEGQRPSLSFQYFL